MAAVLTAGLFFGCKCADKAARAKKPYTTGFCGNSLSWNHWERLVEQFSWDDGMMELHALRLGICSMIYTGQIEPERGLEIFDKAHFAWRARMVDLQLDAFGGFPTDPPAATPQQGGQ